MGTDRAHDPLCLSLLPYGPGDMCDCGTIRMVRADEREAASTRHSIQRERLRAVLRADLRARVEALPQAMSATFDGCIRRADVLALFDGGSE